MITDDGAYHHVHFPKFRAMRVHLSMLAKSLPTTRKTLKKSGAYTAKASLYAQQNGKTGRGKAKNSRSEVPVEKRNIGSKARTKRNPLDASC